MRAAEAPEGRNEIFYLANSEPIPIPRLLDLVERGLGKKGIRVGIPDRVVRLLGAVVEDGARLAGKRTMFGRDKALEMTQKAWCCSAAKAGRRLGWRAQVELEAGMEEALRRYREQGLL